jgi:tetrahydromethanopterin S-methyltransferase subunit A
LKTIIIGKDHFLDKDIKKIKFDNRKMPEAKVFKNSDVIFGNPNSNIAICFIYTWESEFAPQDIRQLADKISNYSAVTGFWRTTNGARYVFSNILSNPNINKILLLVFNRDDNGHLLVESLTKLWLNGVDENGIIKDCIAPNPKFEQVPIEGLNRLKKQADLLVLKSLTSNDFDKIESVIKAGFQEPENAKNVEDFKGLTFYSNVIKNNKIYDNGARFDTPFIIDLSHSSENNTVDMYSAEYLMLAAQRALLNRVVACLRSVSVTLEGTQILWRCIFDNNAFENDIALLKQASCEVMKDYNTDFTIKEIYEIVSFPDKMNMEKNMIYLRNEYNVFN